MTGPDPRIVYADIIDLPHHQSGKHPQMSLYNRAAQFAPFAALSGYEDMIFEESRETEMQTQPEEWEMEKISQKLNLIADVIQDGHHPTLSITCFIPDEKKAGGSYVTVTEQIKRLDAVRKKVILMKKQGRAGLNAEIDFDRITDIRGELVDYLDESM
jgi:hypothetical protein